MPLRSVLVQLKYCTIDVLVLEASARQKDHVSTPPGAGTVRNNYEIVKNLVQQPYAPLLRQGRRDSSFCVGGLNTQ